MGKKTAKWSLVILSALVIYTAPTVGKSTPAFKFSFTSRRVVGLFYADLSEPVLTQSNVRDVLRDSRLVLCAAALTLFTSSSIMFTRI
jgi:hypothetical protein